MALRAVLIAVAGAASIAYLAMRQKGSAHLTRELDLETLDENVANWLPKLPYLGYIRLCTGGRPLLRLSGDSKQVWMHLLEPSRHAPNRRSDFRETAALLGIHVQETDGPEPALYCELPAEHETVSRVLDTLLRDVFELTGSSRIQAEVPGTQPNRAS